MGYIPTTNPDPSFPVLYDLLIPHFHGTATNSAHRKGPPAELLSACSYAQNMEAALKARQLGSAKARRLRSAEHEKQKQHFREQREERRKRVHRYSTAYSIAGESLNSRPSSPEHHSSTASSTSTPSEFSVRTPELSFSSDFELSVITAELLAEDLPSMNVEKQELKPARASILRNKSTPQAEKPIVFSASLNKLCDFKYDRFSTIVEPVQVPVLALDTRSDSEDDDTSNEEDYFPVETARSVVIHAPLRKPTVISVPHSTRGASQPNRSSTKSVETVVLRTPVSTPPIPSSKALPTPPTVESSFEDKGYFSPRRPHLGDLTPSTISLPSTTASPIDYVETSSYTSSADSTIRKKPGASTLSRLTHARLGSIKSFIKPQSISGPVPAIPQVPVLHQSRPSTSVNNLLAQMKGASSPRASIIRPAASSNASRRSMTEPVWLRPRDDNERPKTARAPDYADNDFVAAQSELMPAIPSAFVTAVPDLPDEHVVYRKKSFSNLRRRSGSLGQALKGFANSSIKNKTPSQDEPLPALPTPTPTPDSVNMSNSNSYFPTPPRTGIRRSGMLSGAFPNANGITKDNAALGLGLRVTS